VYTLVFFRQRRLVAGGTVNMGEPVNIPCHEVTTVTALQLFIVCAGPNSGGRLQAFSPFPLRKLLEMRLYSRLSFCFTVLAVVPHAVSCYFPPVKRRPRMISLQQEPLNTTVAIFCSIKHQWRIRLSPRLSEKLVVNQARNHGI